MGLMDKAKAALDSDKGERATDTGIDKIEELASKKTGGGHDEQIRKAGEAVDKKLGTN
ncbi:antitoxin protein of toxin-antitoxin system [Frigoribacterium sp. PhB160]|uniref:antitoxin n=1 Tax=Frigoribacterium sp. PhB160 TaxID=2485192 RepID=UPI000F465CD8|nr:antitoxin [Frigoribacterium sp. PhB160]ROS61377.1 antitoxin protein of toxin-antitoxin system [Frigoribacterium sp. PhB160]